MKTLTVEYVRECFERTGLKPINCRWAMGAEHGCAWTAVSSALGKRQAKNEAERRMFLRTHGYDSAYICGVIGGWDDNKPIIKPIINRMPRYLPRDFRVPFIIGYEHGALLRKVILEGRAPILVANDHQNESNALDYLTLEEATV